MVRLKEELVRFDRAIEALEELILPLSRDNHLALDLVRRAGLATDGRGP
jgi:hypothetical protein